MARFFRNHDEVTDMLAEKAIHARHNADRLRDLARRYDADPKAFFEGATVATAIKNNGGIGYVRLRAASWAAEAEAYEDAATAMTQVRPTLNLLVGND